MAEMPEKIDIELKFDEVQAVAALSPLLEMINEFWERTRKVAELVVEALEQQQTVTKADFALSGPAYDEDHEACSDGMMHQKGSGCPGRPDSEKSVDPGTTPYDEDHEECSDDEHVPVTSVTINIADPSPDLFEMLSGNRRAFPQVILSGSPEFEFVPPMRSEEEIYADESLSDNEQKIEARDNHIRRLQERLRGVVTTEDEFKQKINDLQREIRNLNKGMERVAKARDAAEEEVASHVSGIFNIRAMEKIEALQKENEDHVAAAHEANKKIQGLQDRNMSLSDLLDGERAANVRLTRERNEAERSLAAWQGRARLSEEEMRQVRAALDIQSPSGAMIKDALKTYSELQKENEALKAQIEDRGPLYTKEEALKRVMIQVHAEGYQLVFNDIPYNRRNG